MEYIYNMSEVQQKDKKKRTYLRGEYAARTTLNERKTEYERINGKHPGKIPVIVERNDKNVPELSSYRYLVNGDFTISQFMIIIRSRIQLKKEQALYLFINNTLCTGSQILSEVYKEHKSDCGFLFFVLCVESAFGNSISSKQDGFTIKQGEPEPSDVFGE